VSDSRPPRCSPVLVNPAFGNRLGRLVAVIPQSSFSLFPAIGEQASHLGHDWQDWRCRRGSINRSTDLPRVKHPTMMTERVLFVDSRVTAHPKGKAMQRQRARGRGRGRARANHLLTTQSPHTVSKGGTVNGRRHMWPMRLPDFLIPFDFSKGCLWSSAVSLLV